jgi:uncharacterized protein YukE
VADTITLGSTQFNVDLKQIQAAIGVLKTEYASLDADSIALAAQFALIEAAWQSPAGDTFAPLKQSLAQSFTGLLDLLQQMILRMQTTYTNYEQAEAANARNLTPS